jgi:hypothetical protein
MDNAELIARVRSIAKHGADWRINWVLNRAADLIEAQEKRIAELENDLMCGTVSEPERFGINGYSMKDLLLFAEMCKRNDVSEADLKQAAWNLELAVRAVMNERQEIVKNTMDEITMRFTPDFEKAYAEMMPNCGARMKP